jgi:RNA polymerase sigma-70 factor (ECF subfamily)
MIQTVGRSEGIQMMFEQQGSELTMDGVGAFAGNFSTCEDAAVDARRAAELEMVRQVQSGDQRAFRELLEKYQGKVHSIIFGILRNREDTEDIAQQVFTKVYFAIKDFDCRCLLLTWICRIAINECYSHLRKKRIAVVQEPEEAPEHAANLTPVDKTMAQRDFLNKLMAKLPEEDRWLLIEKEVEGHSISELSQMTGMTASAIKIKLFRARHKLIQAAERLSLRPGFTAAAHA